MSPPHALHPLARACLGALALAAPVLACAQNSPAAQTVQIIGTSPLPGQGVDRDALPYNTQVLRRPQVEQAQADNLTDLLARRLPGVQVNDIQGSPFQGDLTFRGFRASGLLGASQGLSVYLDGVRINEPFGDVVNWDLIPEFALASVALVPGANPAYGLNTLGGALALRTADGRSAPGVQGEVRVGSFGRKQLNLSQGGSSGPWQHFVGVGLFDEAGWRDHSAGRLGSLLAKVGRRTDAGDITATLLAARSKLVGNGLVPLYTFDEDDLSRTPDLGEARRSAVYTHPDQTEQRLTQASLQWQHSLGPHSLLEAQAYLRQTRRETINGDEAEEAEDDANASFNRTATRQRGSGVALALSTRSGAHQWQLGLSLDRARVHYEQTEQEGRFTDSRGVVALPGEDPELSADLSGSSRSLGLYITDTWRLAPATHVTGTMRYNDARVGNSLTSVDDDTGELESHPHESFRYRSWSPALGLAHRLGGTAGGVTLFANVARNTRVPTAMELGCADPDEPCRLPSGLQADPYLKPVRSTTTEMGLRWGGATGVAGSVTLFRSINRDEILFSSVSVTGQLGYFRNFDRTRHQGLDAELQWRDSSWEASVAYSRLDATYQASGTLRVGERNVAVTPGTPLAGLPRHLLKLALQWQPVAGWQLGLDTQTLSSRVVAGNEDGRFDNDEDTRADFSLPGYTVVNLRASWSPAGMKGLELFAHVHNVFNRRYASFGALAETLFDRQGAYSGNDHDALFAAPGAPRAVAVGLRARF